ncbi:hypothetical protein MHH52_23230 [Paenibacillus sp. FSL K6-0276]|uniref:hypothetical protein n=1 Tax=Paenibacillus sp. FSL K6-0276 TaxID=2921450 RepID=UPI0030EF5561
MYMLQTGRHDNFGSTNRTGCKKCELKGMIELSLCKYTLLRMNKVLYAAFAIRTWIDVSFQEKTTLSSFKDDNRFS